MPSARSGAPPRQLLPDAHDVIHTQAPRASCGPDTLPQQALAVFDWAAQGGGAVEVQKIEREVSKPVQPPLGYRIAQRVEMGDAAIVRNGNLPVQHHWRELGFDQP